MPTRAGPEGVQEALTLRAAEMLLGAVLSALSVREPSGALLMERAAVSLALAVTSGLLPEAEALGQGETVGCALLRLRVALRGADSVLEAAALLEAEGRVETEREAVVLAVPVLLTELQPEVLMRGLLERVPVAAAEAVEHREEDTVPEPLPRELLLLSPVALPVGMVARALPVTPRLPVASLVGLLARPLRVGLSCVWLLGADGEGEWERVMLPLTLRLPPPPLLALTVPETEGV